MAIVDFSAQFGGRDAAAAVLPHFKILKSAAKGVSLSEFPFPKLAFILRVDGDVNQYGESGIGNMDIDSKKKYLSLDIVITKKDRKEIQSKIISGLNESIELIDDVYTQKGIGDFNRESLKSSITTICKKYTSELDSEDGVK